MAAELPNCGFLPNNSNNGNKIAGFELPVMKLPLIKRTNVIRTLKLLEYYKDSMHVVTIFNTRSN